MIHDPRELVALLHAGPTRLVFEFAGAGASALALLHAVGGSSRTVLEATDRYAAGSLAEALGWSPAQAVSADVAAALALRARARAGALAPAGESVAGVGLTATIATDRAKRGEHRVWVAAADGLAVRLAGLVLRKGARDRDGEEDVVARLALRAMAEAKGVLRDLELPLLEGEAPETALRPGPELADFAAGGRDVVAIDAAGRCVEALPWPAASAREIARAERLARAADDVTPVPVGALVGAAPVPPVPVGALVGAAPVPPVPVGALVSGAFHPLHDGHLGLAAAAGRHLGRPVAFELAVANADKPTIPLGEAHRRAAQFAGRAPLLLTRAARFDEKARLLPGTVFVLGVDTAARVLEARFYDGPDGLDAAMAAVRAAGGRFLVAGRRSERGFLTLADLDVPAAHADLFEALPAAAFRADVSSSSIRSAWTAADAERPTLSE